MYLYRVSHPEGEIKTHNKEKPMKTLSTPLIDTIRKAGYEVKENGGCQGQVIPGVLKPMSFLSITGKEISRQIHLSDFDGSDVSRDSQGTVSGMDIIPAQLYAEYYGITENQVRYYRDGGYNDKKVY